MYAQERLTHFYNYIRLICKTPVMYGGVERTSKENWYLHLTTGSVSKVTFVYKENKESKM